MLSAAGQLSAAQLGIYLLLVFPASYALYKHERHGALGWSFLVAFCILRIVGAALQISDEKKHSAKITVQIVSGVGLSPLILAVIGILYEANHYLRGPKQFLLRFPVTIVLHLIVAAALALVILGYQSHQENGQVLACAGYMIFAVLWVITLALVAFSWRQRHCSCKSKMLLMAVITSLPFLGVRILFSCIAAFDSTAFTGSIAYKIVLAVLMELSIVITLVESGIWAGNIVLENKEMDVMLARLEKAELNSGLEI
ncbi:MAG: hypothetical protein M1818_002294 [Claussenomyces sp. TS43310]|nr:MAG: hypothetical protein M1818_002294 [Claussenomyces sp. TS43310]